MGIVVFSYALQQSNLNYTHLALLDSRGENPQDFILIFFKCYYKLSKYILSCLTTLKRDRHIQHSICEIGMMRLDSSLVVKACLSKEIAWELC